MNGSIKNRTISWRKILLFFNYIKLAINAIRKSSEQDIIISWNFIVGAFVGFFCQIFGIKRTILSLNMISHDKSTFYKILREIVYNVAFKYKNFYTTVNSKELINSYSVEYKLHLDHFFALPDCVMSDL